MAITAQGGTYGARWRRFGASEQPGQISGLLASRRLSNDFGSCWANSSKGLQRAVLHQTVKLNCAQSANSLRSTSKGADPIGRSASTLQLEGDLPQCHTGSTMTVIPLGR
jgi:hypothetical protein